MIMEPLMATAAEATDMVRVGRSAVFRLITARHIHNAALWTATWRIEATDARCGRPILDRLLLPCCVWL
jgi:hypothetical protein